MNQTTKLGHSPISVCRLGLGCMGMSEFYGAFDETESIRTLHRAVDLGASKAQVALAWLLSRNGASSSISMNVRF